VYSYEEYIPLKKRREMEEQKRRALMGRVRFGLQETFYNKPLVQANLDFGLNICHKPLLCDLPTLRKQMSRSS